MANDKEDFNLIGPSHLTVVDWDNDNHRRSVAASLVCGVYVLEGDRQEKRHGPQALAPPWWEFFHFRLVRPLVDNVDCSIFGAVFEYTLKPSHHSIGSSTVVTQLKKPIPTYVVAFRGTLTRGDCVSRDIEHDLHIIKNGLHKTLRMEIALQSARDTVAIAHGSNSHVWLTGHSLGAAMGMVCGKNMALTGCFLESYFFNPPFISAPIEKIKDQNVKHGLRIVGSVVTAGLAFATSIKQPEKVKLSVDPFAKLSPWVPNLFVHRGDHICSEYIGYFEHQKKMEQLGVGGIGKLAAQHSFGGLVMTALGKEAGPALHLIPSACLAVNTTPAPDFKKAHALRQWWRNDIQLQTTVYLN